MNLKTDFKTYLESHFYDNRNIERNRWIFRFSGNKGLLVICNLYKGKVVSFGCKTAPFEAYDIHFVYDYEIKRDGMQITRCVGNYLSEERINDILHEMDNPKKKETFNTSLTR